MAYRRSRTSKPAKPKEKEKPQTPLGDFAAIDFETANSHTTSACSVGIVIVRNGKVADRFYSLIKPQPEYYDFFCTKVHGLKKADTANAPLFPEVWAQVAPRLSGLTLVAHNKSFDEHCLKELFAYYGMEYPNYPFRCTLQASRRTWPEGKHSLDIIAARCGFDLKNHHNALADAEACAAIAMKIMCREHHEEDTVAGRLEKWAQHYVPQFNALAEKHNRYFCTQSPLDVVEREVDTMIVGINPKGTGGYKGPMTPADYLAGNPQWYDRFNTDGTINRDWRKYLGNVHYFLGHSNLAYHAELDDDSRTIWTNITPFNSVKGSSDIEKELTSIGVESTLALIQILRPKRILLLGVEGFSTLKRYAPKEGECVVRCKKVFPNLGIQIGRIAGIRAVCTNHPSGQWPVSNRFTTIFMKLVEMIDTEKNGIPEHTLEEVVAELRKEVGLWQTGIKL